MTINKNVLKLFDLIGAYQINNSNKSLWFIPQIGEKRIQDYTTVLDILESIYEKGIESGKEIGKKELVNKFKNLMNIYDPD